MYEYILFRINEIGNRDKRMGQLRANLAFHKIFNLESQVLFSSSSMHKFLRFSTRLKKQIGFRKFTKIFCYILFYSIQFCSVSSTFFFFLKFCTTIEGKPLHGFKIKLEKRKKNILPLSLKLLIYPKSIKSNHDCFVFKTIEYETWASPKEIVVTPLYPGQRSVCF